MSAWPVSGLDRPIRVVLFGGKWLEPAALRFAARLEAHPDIELSGIFCQGEGDAFRIRARDVWQRWGVLGPPILLREMVQARLGGENGPRERGIRSRARYVPDLHAPALLDHIRTLRPDLGLIYGSPILRPVLFEIPAFGTLGIHHGTLPEYRGRKTTFWAMYNGERAAGVAIQRVNAGVDTGDIVAEGEVVIGRKPLRRVWAELQDLGIELYLDAVLSVRAGTAALRPQPRPPRDALPRLYRQPRLGDVIRYGLRRWRRTRAGGAGR